MLLLATTDVTMVAAQAANRALADVSASWETYVFEDSVDNVDLEWRKNWYFRVLNLADETHDAIQNPRITVATPLELLEPWPNPTVSGPSTYEWTYGSIPEGFSFFAGGCQEEYLADRPRFSASRSVSPQRLVEDVTSQEVVVSLTLEEPLPSEVNELSVVIGFVPIVGLEIWPLVNYTVLGYEGPPGWEVFPWGASGVQWYTFVLSDVAIGNTYEFRATFQAVKSEFLEGSPVSKPDVTVIWRRVEWEPPQIGGSVTIEYPYEDLTATFESSNELRWSKMISSLYHFLGFWRTATPIVGEEPPFRALSSLRFELHSNADLHIYDPYGRHVGLNYLTGEEEVEIPGATYQRDGSQMIVAPEPVSGDYRVVLVGTSTGSYELVVEGATETGTFPIGKHVGSIEAGGKAQYVGHCSVCRRT